jgi:hypothetical protein
LALIPEGMDPKDVPLPPSVEQLKNPLEAEGGGTPQPTDSTIPTASVPIDPTASTVAPAETPSTAPPTTTGG